MALTQPTVVNERGTEGVDMKLGVVVVPVAGIEAAPAPDRKSYGSFGPFSDPDGNGWLLQEITTRLPGR